MSGDETRPLEAAPDDAPQPVKGRVIGRYVLLERLGAGGGGEVFSAFDPTLDRRVAVKLLHADGQGANALLREGRLLAKLVHPNIVAIHDSGLDGGQAYLAMELVDGPSIERFAAEERAASRLGPLLDALREVGTGLAAAHRSDLIHGDIKPSNILRSAEGPAKLSDFGIAQLSDGDAVLGGAGTPAFMAPEQHAGAPASALADQYAFCLTAFVLLHGAHPFATSPDTLATSGASDNTPLGATGPRGGDLVEDQRAWTPTWRPDLPRPLARALERGLSPNPEDRWPSMDALVEALATRHPQRRRSRMLAVGAVAALAGAGALVASNDASVDPCAHAGDGVEQSWNPEVRAKLVQAWDAAPDPFADSLTRVLASVDGFSEAWRTTSAEVCAATHTHGLQSPQMLDVRSDCLRHAQVVLEETVELVTTEDPEIWSESVEVVEALPDPRLCATTRTTALPEASTPQERERFELAQRLIERARLALDVANLELASEALDSAKAQVRGEAELEAQLLRQQARYLDWSGDMQGAHDAGKRALHLALQQDDIVSAVTTATLQSELLSRQEGRLDEALDYAALAIALSEHADATDEERYSANIAMGNVRNARSEFETALAHFRTAIELGRRAFGDDHPHVATARTHLAVALQDSGRYDAALVEQEAALEARERFFGPDHPTVAQSHHNLSRLYYDLGRPEAERHTRRALEIMIDAFGTHYMPVAIVQGGLGDELRRKGKYEAALEQYEGAIETLTELLGFDASDTLVLRASRAITLANLGRYEEGAEAMDAVVEATRNALGDTHIYLARAHIFRGVVRAQLEDYAGSAEDYAAASQIYVAVGSPEHPGRVTSLVGLADATRLSGDLDEAKAIFEQAQALLQASGSEDANTSANAKLEEGLGELALERGEAEEALGRFERALGLLEAKEASASERSELSLAIARALRALGREDEARARADAALALLDEAPTDVASLRRAIAEFGR